MENTNLEIIVKESGLEQTKAQVLLNNFSNYFEIAAEWENKAKVLIVTNEAQRTEMKMAREGRLFLKEKRVAIEKTRKELKEHSVREGQTIDAIAKILKNLIEPIEEHLEKQEKFIEIKEAERKEVRKIERVKILTALEFDFTYTDLLNMPDAQFDELVLKLENEKSAKIEAERKAEEERLAKEKAEKEEQERIRVENERLKAEIKAKQDEEKRIQDEKIRIEREAKAAEAKALKAPDKDKLILLAKQFDAVVMPELKTSEAIAILTQIAELQGRLVKYIIDKSNEL